MNAYNVLVGNPEGKKPLGRPRKYGGEQWTGFIWLRIGTSGGLL
jgi:hypothetical protein